MHTPSKADHFLLDAIRRGDTDAWSKFVDRFQGRLMAFSQGRLRVRVDAEDVVQDTFVSFLESLDRFRGDASLETYLFSILRRKIVDRYRGGDRPVRSLDDGGWGDLAGREQTASWYVRQDENRTLLRTVLLESLRAVVNRCKRQDRLDDLKMIELLYYRMMRNREIAASLNVTEQRVASFKHRTNERLRRSVLQQLQGQSGGGAVEAADPSSWFKEQVLAELWQRYRISCPKRSTIGGYLLETLEPPWLDYVEFHLRQLDCESCQANLEDLRRQNSRAGGDAFRHRVMESTVGFLRAR